MATVKALDCRELFISRREILGYLGATGTIDAKLNALIESCLDEMLSVITFRVCYEEFPYKKKEDLLDLGFATVKSADLAMRLEGCTSIILLAATLGIGADRLISRYSMTEPSRAVVLQATASAVIEAALDRFCREISKDNMARDRFSCGYGDLPLELQRDIFSALDCERAIGLTLNASCLMSPSKSVTAIIGIEQAQRTYVRDIYTII